MLRADEKYQKLVSCKKPFIGFLARDDGPAAIGERVADGPWFFRAPTESVTIAELVDHR
jgi:hypothetical protein